MPPEGWRFRCLQCGRYHMTLESLDECLEGRCPMTPVDRYSHAPRQAGRRYPVAS